MGTTWNSFTTQLNGAVENCSLESVCSTSASAGMTPQEKQYLMGFEGFHEVVKTSVWASIAYFITLLSSFIPPFYDVDTKSAILRHSFTLCSGVSVQQYSHFNGGSLVCVLHLHCRTLAMDIGCSTDSIPWDGGHGFDFRVVVFHHDKHPRRACYCRILLPLRHRSSYLPRSS